MQIAANLYPIKKLQQFRLNLASLDVSMEDDLTLDVSRVICDRINALVSTHRYAIDSVLRHSARFSGNRRGALFLTRGQFHPK